VIAIHAFLRTWYLMRFLTASSARSTIGSVHHVRMHALYSIIKKKEGCRR
jgi:hypothetical protein